MSKPALGAVVGCGAIAPRHFTAWSLIEDARIVATYDLDGSKAAALAAQFGIARHFTSIAEMRQALPDLDFVDITTPPDTHVDLIGIALAHDLHVLCQKPVAEDSGDLARLVELSRLSSSTVAVNEVWKWLPAYRKVLDLLRSGAAGRIEQVRFSSTGNMLESWRLTPAYRGLFDRLRVMPRLVAFEYGVHIIDLFRTLFGEPETISARIATLHPDISGEDAAWIRLAFSGFSADISLDWSSGTGVDHDVLDRDFMVIRTERGTIRTSAGQHVSWTSLDGNVQDWTFDTDPRAGGFLGSQQDFLRSIREGGAPSSALVDNARTMRLIFACYESARSGRTLSA